MKKIKTILITLATICMLVGCKKDEDGHYIRYYKNKVAIGYVFYKDSFNNLRPAEGIMMRLSATYSSGGELFGTYYKHIDTTFTNSDGQCSFYLVKTINSKKTTHYQVNTYGQFIDISEIKDKEKILLDTIFINQQ